MKVPFFCLLILALNGCASLDSLSIGSSDKVEVLPRVAYKPESNQNTIHYYSDRLANQLFQSLTTVKPNAKLAIGTFTAIDTLKAPESKNSPTYLYGLQIADSFLTTSTQRGFAVVEFKTLKGIKITKNHDLMLSRDVSELKGKHDVDYFLTGTMTQQETGLVVNARLIDVNTNIVVAAATDYMPINSLWSDEKVKSRNGVITRSSY